MLLGLIVFHVIICIFITIVVLLQFGKGAEAGAMMGTAGASQNIFSTSSNSNVITKATNVMAILFVVNSLALTKLMTKKETSSIMDDEEKVIQLQNTAQEKEAPSTPEEVKKAVEEIKKEESK